MMQSRNWKAIERLPDMPGVAKMTGNGYSLDGVFYAAHPVKVEPVPEPRKRWFGR